MVLANTIVCIMQSDEQRLRIELQKVSKRNETLAVDVEALQKKVVLAEDATQQLQQRLDCSNDTLQQMEQLAKVTGRLHESDVTCSALLFLTSWNSLIADGTFLPVVCSCSWLTSAQRRSITVGYSRHAIKDWFVAMNACRTPHPPCLAVFIFIFLFFIFCRGALVYWKRPT
jgi:hypothetical protein